MNFIITNEKKSRTNAGRAHWMRNSNKAIPVQVGLAQKSAKKFCNAPSMTVSSSNIPWKHPIRSVATQSTVRPSTSKSQPSSTEVPNSNHVVVAVAENRSETDCTVGIAVINLANPYLVLAQIQDTQSYENTRTKLNVFSPDEILIPTTLVSGNRLTDMLKQNFPMPNITALSRTLYNHVDGLTRLTNLCASSWKSTLAVVRKMYFAITAAHALLSYLESNLCITYAKESLKLEFQVSEQHTYIDMSTVVNLELVDCASHIDPHKYSSLLGVLDHCKMASGRQLLRSTILQPPCSVVEIEKRLDCVEELRENDSMLTAVQESLHNLVNINQLLALSNFKLELLQPETERYLNYILFLKLSFLEFDKLVDTLSTAKHDELRAIVALLQKPILTRFRDDVCDITHEEARPCTGQMGDMQRCFAIKANYNALLDLIRKRYSDVIDGMHDYVRELGEQYGLTLSLANNAKKGFHICMSLPKNQRYNFDPEKLPEVFITVEKLTASVTMSTIELQIQSGKERLYVREIMKLSNVILRQILLDIRKDMDVFYEISESITKLDMYQSLAFASIIGNNVRPQFGANLAVRSSRHPLLVYLRGEEPIPNDIHASKFYNLHIITGPNASGKSIYIRQVLLLQVMAQVGAFVPAVSAQFRVADRIMSRVGLYDDVATGASTFMVELREVDFIMSTLTDNTLIIMDELFKSTGVNEGTSLAFAVCEQLMQTNAFVFVTTHYMFLTCLQKMYCNVKAWQMALNISEVSELLDTIETSNGNTSKSSRYEYTYKLVPGICPYEAYDICRFLHLWPEDVQQVIERRKRRKTSSMEFMRQVQEVKPRDRLRYDLYAELQLLDGTDEAARDMLIDEAAMQLAKFESYNDADLGEDVDELMRSIAHRINYYKRLEAQQSQINKYCSDVINENSVTYEEMVSRFENDEDVAGLDTIEIPELRDIGDEVGEQPLIPEVIYSQSSSSPGPFNELNNSSQSSNKSSSSLMIGGHKSLPRNETNFKIVGSASAAQRLKSSDTDPIGDISHISTKSYEVLEYKVCNISGDIYYQGTSQISYTREPEKTDISKVVSKSTCGAVCGTSRHSTLQLTSSQSCINREIQRKYSDSFNKITQQEAVNISHADSRFPRLENISHSSKMSSRINTGLFNGTMKKKNFVRNSQDESFQSWKTACSHLTNFCNKSNDIENSALLEDSNRRNSTITSGQDQPQNSQRYLKVSSSNLRERVPNEDILYPCNQSQIDDFVLSWQNNYSPIASTSRPDFMGDTHQHLNQYPNVWDPAFTSCQPELSNELDFERPEHSGVFHGSNIASEEFQCNYDFQIHSPTKSFDLAMHDPEIPMLKYRPSTSVHSLDLTFHDDEGLDGSEEESLDNLERELRNSQLIAEIYGDQIDVSGNDFYVDASGLVIDPNADNDDAVSMSYSPLCSLNVDDSAELTREDSNDFNDRAIALKKVDKVEYMDDTNITHKLGGFKDKVPPSLDPELDCENTTENIFQSSPIPDCVLDILINELEAQKQERPLKSQKRKFVTPFIEKKRTGQLKIDFNLTTSCSTPKTDSIDTTAKSASFTNSSRIPTEIELQNAKLLASSRRGNITIRSNPKSSIRVNRSFATPFKGSDDSMGMEKFRKALNENNESRTGTTYVSNLSPNNNGFYGLLEQLQLKVQNGEIPGVTMSDHVENITTQENRIITASTSRRDVGKDSVRNRSQHAAEFSESSSSADEFTDALNDGSYTYNFQDINDIIAKYTE